MGFTFFHPPARFPALPGRTVAGFTTVRNLGDAGGVTLALCEAIASGALAGPRIVDAVTDRGWRRVALMQRRDNPRIERCLKVILTFQKTSITTP